MVKNNRQYLTIGGGTGAAGTSDEGKSMEELLAAGMEKRGYSYENGAFKKSMEDQLAEGMKKRGYSYENGTFTRQEEKSAPTVQTSALVAASRPTAAGWMDLGRAWDKGPGKVRNADTVEAELKEALKKAEDAGKLAVSAKGDLLAAQGTVLPDGTNPGLAQRQSAYDEAERNAQAAREYADRLKTEFKSMTGMDYDEYTRDDRTWLMKLTDSILDSKAADVAGKAAVSGVSQFATGVANTADLFVGKPLQAVGWKNNPLSQGAEIMNEFNAQRGQDVADAAGDSKGWQVAGQVLSTAVAAAPAALMAYFTGGASLASPEGLTMTAASQGMNGTQLLGQAVGQMMKDPAYWTTFVQEAGNDYREAQKWAKNDETAALYAVTVGLVNSGIEIGLDGTSGIQGLERAVREGETGGLRSWLNSLAEEGFEEVRQGIVSRGMAKAMGSGAPLFSDTDRDAVFNPRTSLEEGALGAASAAMLTGGQMAGQAALSGLRTRQDAGVTQVQEEPEIVRDALDSIMGPVRAQEGTQGSHNAEGHTVAPQGENAVAGNVEGQGQENTAPASGTVGTAEIDKSDARQVVSKLQENLPVLRDMSPVAKLTGAEFPKSSKKITEQVGDFFRSIGNKVHRRDLGNVILDERGVKSDLAHGLGRAKSVTFAAVPDVIANGRQIDYQQNWKGRGYDTYIFAAPVDIGNKTTYVAAVVRSDEQNRFYLHEVIDGDGSLIYRIENAPSAIKTGVTSEGGVTGTEGAFTGTSWGGGQRGVMPDRSGASSDGPNNNVPQVAPAVNSEMSGNGQRGTPTLPSDSTSALAGDLETVANVGGASSVTVPQSTPDVNLESRTDGLGAANRGFATPTRGEMVYTQNNTMNPGTDISPEESERYTPGTHERVSEEMSLERALGQFYQNENGGFVNLEDTVDTLLEKEMWTGADQDAAQIAFRWMNAHRTSLTDEQYNRFWALHRAIEEIGGTEAGRSLQARQKWVESGDSIVSKSMSILDDPRIDKKAAREVLDHVQDLAEKYDRAVEDGNDIAFAEIVREVAVERKTSKTKENGELKKTAEWALRQILEHGDVEFLKNAARSSIVAMAQDYAPQSLTAKAKAIRRDAMLSKISTWARNVVSNNVFDPLDSIARDISVPLDMALSRLTGTRSTAFDTSWFSRVKREGSRYGMARSFLEVSLDISAEGAQSKYGQAGNRTFKMTGGVFSRFMSQWEKISNYAMYSTDQMQKGGIEAEVQRGVDRLYEQGKITDDSLRDAGAQEATFRTFQEDSAIAKGLSVIRQGFNKLAHVGELGLGDILMPFVQVPANLVNITVDYSPAGMARGLWRLTRTLYDAKQGNMTAAQQARAVQTIGRSLTGTGVLALAVLAKMGGALIVSDDGRDENKDKSALESQAGLKGTQLNLSGLSRLLTGGNGKYQDGDTLMSIDFMDPLNALFTMGSLIADDYAAEHEGEKNDLTFGEIASDTTAGITQSVMDLPMMSPFAEAAEAHQYSKADTEGGRWMDAAKQFAAGQVTSFIPNILKGVAQGTDTKQRDLYSSDTLKGQVWDNIKASIPGLRQTLPVKQNSFGEEMEVDDPILNFLNNNILPGSVTKYTPQNPELEAFLDDIFGATGDVTVYPDKKAPNSISKDIDGDGKTEKFLLDYEDRRKYQETYGRWYTELAMEIMDNGRSKFTPDEISNLISGIKSYAGAEAKREYYDENDIEADTSTNFINKAVAGVQEAGIPFVAYLDFWAKKGNLTYEVDAKGNRKVKEAVVKLIDSMDLTDAQKDWLFASENYTNPPAWH